MSRPWFPLYVDAYLGDTSNLTLEEHGAYQLLLMLSWKSKSGLPDDMAWLQRALGAHVPNLHGNRFNKIVRPILERYFEKIDGFWQQEKLEKERTRAKMTSSERREMAKKRWSDTSKNNDLGDAQALLLQDSTVQDRTGGRALDSGSTPIPKKEPSPNNSSSADDGAPFELIAGNPKPPTAGQRFEEFWLAYPRKTAKQAAKLAFVRIAKQKIATFDEIMAGLARYTASLDTDSPICHGASWLNGRRWQDEFETNVVPIRPAAKDPRLERLIEAEKRAKGDIF